MSDTFDLPRDADGFLDMDAFPDDDLDPADAGELESTLQDAPEPDDLDDRWPTLVNRAVDPTAEPVPEELIPPDDATYAEDDPFADVDDSAIPNPFSDDDLDEADTDTDDPYVGGTDDLDDPEVGGTDGGDDGTAGVDDFDDDLFAGSDDTTVSEDDELVLEEEIDLTAGSDVDPVDDLDGLDGLDALDAQLREHGG